MSEVREVLRTEALWKRFGPITAVADLSLSVRQGEVFGFLGPNGSGKSTTVGMVLGLVRPSSGRAFVLGKDVAREPWPALRRVGAVIETPVFYPYLSGHDNLRWLATMLGDVPERRIGEVLEVVGLADRARSAYKTYSLGMKQRLGIASTLLRDPELVILDEPTNGLDPAGTREVRGLIRRLSDEGRAVFLCSHLLHEVQEVCDRVAIVRKGQLVREGRVDELLGRGQYLRLRADDNDALRRALVGIPWAGDVQSLDGYVRVEAPQERAAELNRALAAQDIYLAELRPWETELESVFLELTEEPEA